MQTLRPIDKIVLAALLILALGQGYLIFGGARSAQLSTATTLQGQATDAPAAEIVVPPPSTALIPAGGIAESIGDNFIVIQARSPDGASTPTQNISVSGSTSIVLQGAQKDSVTMEKEMNAFREESRALGQDAVKNHDALTVLIAPSSRVETPITLSDLKAGDSITAFMKDGVAVRVMVSRNQ